MGKTSTPSYLYLQKHQSDLYHKRDLKHDIYPHEITGPLRGKRINHVLIICRYCDPITFPDQLYDWACGAYDAKLWWMCFEWNEFVVVLFIYKRYVLREHNGPFLMNYKWNILVFVLLNITHYIQIQQP